MALFEGMVHDGRVIAGTEWVRRNSQAWWAWHEPKDRPDLRERRGDATLLVGHWTGGHCHEGDEAATKVVRAMKARLRADGSPMSVSVHFVVGWDGQVWQTADLKYAAIHAGKVNGHSIGVETCWPGTYKNAQRLGIYGESVVGAVTKNHRPQRFQCLKPSDELLEGWRKLAETLTSLPAETGIVIPRQVDPHLKRGVGEHWMVPDSTKLDAAGFLVGHLGWPWID